jgi:hypothetical protein
MTQAGAAAVGVGDMPSAQAAGRKSAANAGGAGTQASAAGRASSVSSPGQRSGAASCDMTGKWLVTVHKTTDGLGNLQAVHDYYYYELTQQADAFRVTRSLKCGADAIGGGSFAITIDFTAALAGIITRVSHDGRTGRSASVDGGCQVDFDRQYTVVGATLPYYLDPATALPSAEQMAAGDTPGWEDWDENGQPGITGVCEGAVTGKIFAAGRDWSAFSGLVPETGPLIKLSVEWDQEPNVMAVEGSPFLHTEAVRAADASLHFVELARLTDDMTDAEDLALCRRLVELAPTLTPDAAGL